MAVMIPEEIEGFEGATRRDKDIFRFLKQVARPHKDFICWFKPAMVHTEEGPDFILYGKNLGLLVLTVRDWMLHQIATVTPQRFTIRISGKEQKRENPDKQLKIYVNTISKRLKEISTFINEQHSQAGLQKIPMGRMVIFPNIERQAYCTKGIQWIIPPERALFTDDLDPGGELFRDVTGNRFRERISGNFPFPFKGLIQEELDRLKGLLIPARNIEVPLRPGKAKEEFRSNVVDLDEAQSKLAMQLRRGHQIIKGPAGSGKTLVLIQRCAYLYTYHSQVKRVLFVCYNIALVSYIKQLLVKKGIDVGDPDIQVCHFFELCAQILNEPVHFENEDFEYYNQVIKKTLGKLSKESETTEPFDAIFIEEGQDFNDRMLEIIMALHKPGGDLVIALDPFQDLYKRKRSWKMLGIHASGRTRRLRQVYRNTEEIYDFSRKFIGQKGDPNQQLALLPRTLTLHGEVPLLRRFPNLEAMENFFITDLLEKMKLGNYKKSEIAVIYDDKIYGRERFAYDNRALPMGIFKKMERAGIPVQWVSQDVKTKEMFDVTSDRVSLISIHSSKGLDFDLVYLLGVDHMNLEDPPSENFITLLYVAMTRAKNRLIIPYVRESALIRRMYDCLVGLPPHSKKQEQEQREEVPYGRP